VNGQIPHKETKKSGNLPKQLIDETRFL